MTIKSHGLSSAKNLSQIAHLLCKNANCFSEIAMNFLCFLFSWEWFYAAMKVTREHLRGPWNDGSIVGFIHKRTAEDLLLKCQRGTFLLRFSDSELGKKEFIT
jgi:hypothetical protein